MAEWQPIETAPHGNDLQPCWIIGFTTWGKPGGPTHWHVGACEWVGDHYEFADVDFDVFPRPTHWQTWPEPPSQISEKLRTLQDLATAPPGLGPSVTKERNDAT